MLLMNMTYLSSPVHQLIELFMTFILTYEMIGSNEQQQNYKW